MATADIQREGDLNWRLSSHPVTMLTFLSFRVSSLLIYILSTFFMSDRFVLVFIITTLLLAVDFYYLKNIAGRRLVGLRWWNEVNIETGDSKWVFESAEGRGATGNKTDSRFFWLMLYALPAMWFGFAFLAIVKFAFMWLSLNIIALILTGTNLLAFSRCDKFSQASNLASSAMYSSGLARNLAGGMVSRFFSR